MLLATLAMFSEPIDSPFIVPVAGCIMILGIVVAGIWSGIRNREIQSTERLAAIAKGVAIPPTVEEMAIMHGKPSGNATRRRATVRLAGSILIWGAAGLTAFFIILSSILRERDVLCGAAVGLIPLGIGIALLIDARTQTREMEEAAASAPATSIQPSYPVDRSV